MEGFAKLGMWRCRDGRYAQVRDILPEWVNTLYRVRGIDADAEDTSWEYDGGRWDMNEINPNDLIEHLSDEIVDPRTWKPPVVLREGVWEFDDGSRGVAFAIEDTEDFWVHFFTGRKSHWSVRYSRDGKNEMNSPQPTRFIGPLPTREEKQ